MTVAIEFHRLTSDNASLLEDIADEVFDHPIKPASLDDFLQDPRHVMFVAVDRSQVVGMASGVEYFHPDKSPQFWINEVGVAATHRSRGIGRTLVATMANHARERGCSYAWLGTEADNQPAQRCFGSVPDGEEPQPFLLYEWDLED